MSTNELKTGPEWVRDEPRVREFDGKRLKIHGKGIFTMHVKEEDSSGNKNPGFVIVEIEPWDLDAAMLSESPKEGGDV
ncbi:hypothetical protein KGP36_02690 [Patescibacteria group bacterium]|nr:hypothetical protein [Patescibacteria group bacterium]